MASSDRFYQMQLSNRPAYWGDLGERIKIVGMILEGAALPVVILMPDSNIPDQELEDATVIRPSIEEWSEIIRNSDDPQVFLLDSTGGIKAIHRKLRYVVSGDVQQKVWARDDFKCMFCGRRMGEVQLSIDHFMPLEMGGANEEWNYLSACRKCNKRKGGLHPKEFCQERGINYEDLVSYLERVSVTKPK